jgi:hypothetical protein
MTRQNQSDSNAAVNYNQLMEVYNYAIVIVYVLPFSGIDER